MAGRPLIEVRDLLGHSTVKMTERYAHLAPENLVDAVSSIETRLHYGSTPDDSNKVTGEENHQVLEFTDENWWARKDSNLRPMDYESTALFMSGPQKSDKFNTFKHLNPALACLEWTERDRKGLQLGTF